MLLLSRHQRDIFRPTFFIAVLLTNSSRIPDWKSFSFSDARAKSYLLTSVHSTFFQLLYYLGWIFHQVYVDNNQIYSFWQVCAIVCHIKVFIFTATNLITFFRKVALANVTAGEFFLNQISGKIIATPCINIAQLALYALAADFICFLRVFTHSST